MNTDDTLTQRNFPSTRSWPVLSRYQRTAINLSFLAMAVFLVHFRTFAWLHQIWWTDPRYSHGFLIPLVASYLVWIKRNHLLQLSHKPHLAMGGFLLLVSTILHLAGRAGGYVLIEAASLLILFPGIVLFVWGPGHLRALILPLAYLQFMIPWIEEFLAQFSLPFQRLSAHLAALLLQAMGFSVFQEATYLQVSNIALDVAPACSGIGYLYSIIALGIPLVYLTQRTWWRATAVLVFAAAITIPANAARVALIGAVGTYYGESTLHGPFHTFQGLIVTQVGILCLFLVNWAVTQLPCKSRVALYERWSGLTAENIQTDPLSRTTGPFVILMLSLLGLACYLHFSASPQPVPPRQSLAELPQIIDRWHGRDSAWMEGTRFFPGATMETVRTYRTTPGREIHLYIGYFASQRGSESLTSKSSNPIRHDARELPLPRTIAELPRLNHSLPTIDGTGYEALFWYHLPSGKTIGRYETKWRQFLDAVVSGHSNGAVVLLATPAPENQQGSAAVDELLEFATALAPVLGEFLP